MKTTHSIFCLLTSALMVLPATAERPRNMPVSDYNTIVAKSKEAFTTGRERSYRDSVTGHFGNVKPVGPKTSGSTQSCQRIQVVYSYKAAGTSDNAIFSFTLCQRNNGTWDVDPFNMKGGADLPRNVGSKAPVVQPAPVKPPDPNYTNNYGHKCNRTLGTCTDECGRSYASNQAPPRAPSREVDNYTNELGHRCQTVTTYSKRRCDYIPNKTSTCTAPDGQTYDDIQLPPARDKEVTDTHGNTCTVRPQTRIENGRKVQKFETGTCKTDTNVIYPYGEAPPLDPQLVAAAQNSLVTLMYLTSADVSGVADEPTLLAIDRFVKDEQFTLSDLPSLVSKLSEAVSRQSRANRKACGADASRRTSKACIAK